MSQTYTPTPPATSDTHRPVRRALVAVWVVFTLGALAFVGAIGTNAPYADEWEFVPALVGDEPGGAWLWQQHNEHRMPLPRFVVLVYFKLTHDFRTGMVLQIAMLAGLALGLMRLAASLRGRPHWADAFFPVSLLHIGHWENFVMGYQVCFVLFAVLAASLAVVALRTTRENAFRSGTLAGILLLLLALTGGSGLVLVPPVVLWLAFVAFGVWRSGAKGNALLLFALALAPVAYLAVYFQGYHRPEHHPAPSSDVVKVATVAGEVLAVSLGMGLSLVWQVVAAALVVIGSLTLVAVAKRWKEPAERLSVVGLLAVAAGVTGVALAVGVGRAGFDTWEQMGLWSRYSMLSWPLLATAYLAWAKLGGKWVPVALCVAAALAFPGNTGTGMTNGAAVRGDYTEIAADAAAGLSAEQITDETDPRRAFPRSHHGAQKDRALRAIPLLRRDRIGIFAR